MQAFVDKFRAKASKAKQAQSRLKALEKMQSKPQLKNAGVPNFHIPSSKILAPPILNLSDASVGYNKKTILKDLNLRSDPEDRIALLGANGQGKSTFSKLVAGKLSLMSGTMTTANHLRIGYFSQDLVDDLILHESAFDHVVAKMVGASKGTVRNSRRSSFNSCGKPVWRSKGASSNVVGYIRLTSFVNFGRTNQSLGY